MARDLFAETFTPRPQPKRSRWTIGGSLFAHVAAVGVLLVLPILSVTDSLVVEAKKVIFIAPPPPIVPTIPPPPVARTQAPPMEIDPTVAPAFSPDKPVTADTPEVGPAAPVPAGAWRSSSGASPVGLLTGSRATTLGTPPPSRSKARQSDRGATSSRRRASPTCRRCIRSSRRRPRSRARSFSRRSSTSRVSCATSRCCDRSRCSTAPPSTP